ncbi:MAG TPA: DUF3047 domain-containing protein, partial [Rhodospirillaceae bacterium]|nr:DUF3047 domain-containing protein [Rhodospirillaceae bacterium]
MRLLLPVIGCLATATVSAAETGLSVFSDQVAFAIEAPGPEQRSHGFFGGGSLSGLYPSETPGRILLVTPPGNALTGRRLDVPVERLPLLSWTWRRLPLDMGPPEAFTTDAPMRLVIGFEGGDAARPLRDQDNSLPPCQRALVIIWSNDAWESGASDRKGPVARFIAHGGVDDRQWWSEEVDLAGLHGRLWPSVPLAEVRIAWVAAAVRASAGRSLGEIAGIT